LTATGVSQDNGMERPWFCYARPHPGTADGRAGAIRPRAGGLPPRARGKAAVPVSSSSRSVRGAAGATLTRPDKRLTDFDQSFYLTIAYDCVTTARSRTACSTTSISTRAVPKPGMFFAPLYPLAIAGVAALDPQFAATSTAPSKPTKSIAEIGSCGHHAWPMHVPPRRVSDHRRRCRSHSRELIFSGAAVFYLAGVLAALGLACEAICFRF